MNAAIIHRCSCRTRSLGSIFRVISHCVMLQLACSGRIEELNICVCVRIYIHTLTQVAEHTACLIHPDRLQLVRLNRRAIVHHYQSKMLPLQRALTARIVYNGTATIQTVRATRRAQRMLTETTCRRVPAPSGELK